YYFAGEAVHKMNRKQRSELNKKNIGFVFQSYHLLDNLTVAENLDLPLSYKDIKKSERTSMVCDTLDRFNIVGKKDLYPNQLSGGQQQLVGVARAVINKPKLILADEPTGNLHSDQAKEIMELFRQLNEAGRTIKVHLAQHRHNLRPRRRSGRPTQRLWARSTSRSLASPSPTCWRHTRGVLCARRVSRIPPALIS